MRRIWMSGLLLSGLLLWANGLWAAGENRAATSEAPDQPQLRMAGIDRFEVAHEYLSSKVELLSRRLDNFFGEDRSYEEANDSYLQVRGSTIVNEEEVFFDGEFRAKLLLPNLSRYLRLVIESRDEDEDPSNPRITTGDTNLQQSLETSELTAGVELALEEISQWRLSFQPGFRVDDLDPTFKIRARRQSGEHGGWQNRLTLRPTWYESRGWEASVIFDLERIVLEDALFRSSTQAFWKEEEEENYRFGQLFQYIDPLNDTTSLAYEVGVTARTQPRFEDESYYGSVRFRRDIHRGWMFVEVKPQLLFARDHDFDPDPSLALTLELLIGEPYRNGAARD